MFRVQGSRQKAWKIYPIPYTLHPEPLNRCYWKRKPPITVLKMCRLKKGEGEHYASIN